MLVNLGNRGTVPSIFWIASIVAIKLCSKISISALSYCPHYQSACMYVCVFDVSCLVLSDAYVNNSITDARCQKIKNDTAPQLVRANSSLASTAPPPLAPVTIPVARLHWPPRLRDVIAARLPARRHCVQVRAAETR